MKCERLSSSKISTYGFCEFKYFLEYHLGFQSVSGKAALIGTIVHAVLATLARKKGKWDWERVLDRYWSAYAASRTDLDMRKIGARGELADWKKTKKAVKTVLDSKLNPINLDIISIEEKFQLEFKSDKWITEKGNQLVISGIIDVIHKIDDDTIEIIDFKTGRMADWATGEPLDLKSIAQEIQPRIYHMAVHHLYPQYKNISIIFYYMLTGGIMPVILEYSDIKETEKTLYSYFKRIKNNNNAYRIKPSWRCKLCSFSKNGVCDAIYGSLEL